MHPLEKTLPSAHPIAGTFHSIYCIWTNIFFSAVIDAVMWKGCHWFNAYLYSFYLLVWLKDILISILSSYILNSVDFHCSESGRYCVAISTLHGSESRLHFISGLYCRSALLANVRRVSIWVVAIKRNKNENENVLLKNYD